MYPGEWKNMRWTTTARKTSKQHSALHGRTHSGNAHRHYESRRILCKLAPYHAHTLNARFLGQPYIYKHLVHVLFIMSVSCVYNTYITPCKYTFTTITTTCVSMVADIRSSVCLLYTSPSPRD